MKGLDVWNGLLPGLRGALSDECADLCGNDGRHGKNTKDDDTERQEVTGPLSAQHSEKLAEQGSNAPSPNFLWLNKTEDCRCSAYHRHADGEIGC